MYLLARGSDFSRKLAFSDIMRTFIARVFRMSLDQSHSGCSESEPFALQVLGDDMAPEFPDGCIIIGEPNAVAIDGCYVIAQHDGEYIFRQLHIDADSKQWTLTALKQGLPTLKIAGREEVRARVVQSTSGRRKTRKFYV